MEQNYLKERYELVLERIRMIQVEHSVANPYRMYFREMGLFIEHMAELFFECETGKYQKLSLEELRNWNQVCYETLEEEQYKTSYANPTYAVQQLGEEFGKLFSFLASELYSLSVYAVEQQLEAFVIHLELFMEIYNLFEEDVVSYKKVRDVIYWFESDYCDVLLPKRIKEKFCPEDSLALSIVTESNLDDERYLYLYGEPIREQEEELVKKYHAYSEEEIEQLATEVLGRFLKSYYQKGNEKTSKNIIEISYQVGMEVLVRCLIKHIKNEGFTPLIYRRSVHSLYKLGDEKGGYGSIQIDEPYRQDHRFDDAIYLDKAFLERKLSVVRHSLEEQNLWIKCWAGQIDLVEPKENEKAFSDEEKKEESIHFNEKQMELDQEFQEVNRENLEQWISFDQTSYVNLFH